MHCSQKQDAEEVERHSCHLQPIAAQPPLGSSFFLCGAEHATGNRLVHSYRWAQRLQEESRLWRSRKRAMKMTTLTGYWAAFFARLELPEDYCLIDTGAQSAICGRHCWAIIMEHIAKQDLRQVTLAQPAMGTTQGIGGHVIVTSHWAVTTLDASCRSEKACHGSIHKVGCKETFSQGLESE
eukprot:6457382-Amphidinium_carterae.3